MGFCIPSTLQSYFNKLRTASIAQCRLLGRLGWFYAGKFDKSVSLSLVFFRAGCNLVNLFAHVQIVVLFGSFFRTQDRKDFMVDCFDLTCGILSHLSYTLLPLHRTHSPRAFSSSWQARLILCR